VFEVFIVHLLRNWLLFHYDLSIKHRKAFMDKLRIIRRSIQWFKNSGIMHPADGFWGVGERILVAEGNEAIEKINKYFYCQTILAPTVLAIEHRRADCNFETALEFDIASDVLKDPSLRIIAHNLIEFLTKRSALRHVLENDPTHNLWGWSMPLSSNACWTDDNSWVITMSLILARRGRNELKEAGTAAARQMRKHMKDFYNHLDKNGKEAKYENEVMAGTNLSPHWLGLTTMAFSHAAVADPDTDYTNVVAKYYEYAPSGPPKFMTETRTPTITGLPWTLSEYGYLAFSAAVAAKQFGLASARDAAKLAADALVEHQHKDGHFAAEHDEAPIAPHLADLIYTQNWATLGLYHAWLFFERDEKYRKAFDKSLTFLARIQDKSKEKYFKGCWRGLYDTKARKYGGGDKWEGGQGSIYSGWTNAPIALAFLFDVTGESLFT
jgi:hypothetical protein